MKKVIALVLVFVICISLCACGGNTLNGTYVSESGTYTVELNKDGTCTWYQDGSFFNGTYEKTDSGWQLNISGSGFYSNTVFNAETSGKNLVITGGAVYGELFIKQ